MLGPSPRHGKADRVDDGVHEEGQYWEERHPKGHRTTQRAVEIEQRVETNRCCDEQPLGPAQPPIPQRRKTTRHEDHHDNKEHTKTQLPAVAHKGRRDVRKRVFNETRQRQSVFDGVDQSFAIDTGNVVGEVLHQQSTNEWTDQGVQTAQYVHDHDLAGFRPVHPVRRRAWVHRDHEGAREAGNHGGDHEGCQRVLLGLQAHVVHARLIGLHCYQHQAKRRSS